MLSAPKSRQILVFFRYPCLFYLLSLLFCFLLALCIKKQHLIKQQVNKLVRNANQQKKKNAIKKGIFPKTHTEDKAKTTRRTFGAKENNIIANFNYARRVREKIPLRQGFKVRDAACQRRKLVRSARKGKNSLKTLLALINSTRKNLTKQRAAIYFLRQRLYISYRATGRSFEY